MIVAILVDFGHWVLAISLWCCISTVCNMTRAREVTYLDERLQSSGRACESRDAAEGAVGFEVDEIPVVATDGAASLNFAGRSIGQYLQLQLGRHGAK